jgi:hypothetical protein
MASLPQHGSPPRVIFWYKLYRVFLLLMFLSVTGVGAAVAFRPEETLGRLMGTTPFPGGASGLGALSGDLFMSAGSVAAVLTAISFFLRRSRTAYVYHVMVMTLGTVSALFCMGLDLLCLASMVTLLIFWVRPDVQAYYGWSTELDRLRPPAV